MTGSLLLLGFLFFVLKAWFDRGDEIDAHNREMERIKRDTAQGHAALIAWFAAMPEDDLRRDWWDFDRGTFKHERPLWATIAAPAMPPAGFEAASPGPARSDQPRPQPQAG